MKLISVIFNHIRNFNDVAEFDFRDTARINTISGKNGSGKTTIFKSIILCQKAFFLTQISNDWEENKMLGSELSKFFTNKSSYIKLIFEVKDNDVVSNASFTVKRTPSPDSGWALEVSDEDDRLIKLSWNIADPKDIIVYIDSNKSFIETDILYDNISISSQSDYSALLLNTILHPEAIFQNIYTTLIRNYLRERLVPSKPRKDLFFNVTKIQLKELIPEIVLSNFSGNQFANQFVLLGKATSRRHSTFYDVRNFSSGEKVLFYILLYINHVQKIGSLIIDEPENHFHEDLLVRFIKMLDEIAKREDYFEYISILAKKHNMPLPKEARMVYKTHNLSQIFLLTHSKNLIYNNLYNESNFYVDNALKRISYAESEKVLREIGISSIYSRVLFVEGSTDTDFFDAFFNEHNIKVRPLNGCVQVIDTYKKVKNIKEFLHDSHFCFLIDRDTRTDQEIERLRSSDEDYFDSHFLVLDRHEFESYLLDPEIYKEIFRRHNESFSLGAELPNDIEAYIFSHISTTRDQVFRKHLSKLNGNSIGKLNEHFRKRDMPVDSVGYTNYINGKFDNFAMDEFLKREFETNFNECETIYAEDNWRNNWKILCDGKAGLASVNSAVSSLLGITFKRIRSDIKSVVSKGNYEINGLITNILRKFNV